MKTENSDEAHEISCSTILIKHSWTPDYNIHLWHTSLLNKCLFCQINDAKQAAQDTKDQAKDLQDRINNNMDLFERDKNKTKELIQRVKDFLLG